MDYDFGLESCSFVLVIVGRHGAFGVVRAVAGVVAWSTKEGRADTFQLLMRSSFEMQQ